MSKTAVNQGRRRFLTAATSLVGTAGAVAVAIPFVVSWSPSAKAKAAGAPVKQDISKLEPGGIVIAEWRGQPVYLIRRTPDALASLAKVNDLRDPQSVDSEQPSYVDKQQRSIKPEILVLLAKCTHLGCAPKYRPDVGAADLSAGGTEWRGGFFCPCHGSRFDLAGRVFKGVPAPLNLIVPPHHFEGPGDSVVVIGIDKGAA